MAATKTTKKTAAPVPARAAAKRKTPPKKGRAKRGRPGPEMAAQWSILLFGIGVLLLALTYVQGEAGWGWVRTNLLFGVFGISAYCLAPLVLYGAVCVAMEQPVRKKFLSAFLLMALISGAYLIFSNTDMTGFSFSEGIAALFTSGTQPWGLGAGALGAVFGWPLLALCGRPGANIIMAVLILIGLMLFTGITPADLYWFFHGRASSVKQSVNNYSVQHAEARETRALARIEYEEQQAEQAATQQALAMANSARGPIDRDTYAAAVSGREAQMRTTRRGSVDIDLGPENTTITLAQTLTAPDIGPGGTFGREAVQEVLHGQPAARMPVPVPLPDAPQNLGGAVVPDAEFGSIITRRKGLDVPDLPFEVDLPHDRMHPEPKAISVPQAQSQPQPQTQTQTQAVPEPQSDAANIARLAQKAVLSSLGAQAEGNAPVQPLELMSGYAYPPLSLFQKQPPDNEQNVQEELAHNADLLVKTLSSFGVQTRVLDISRGPAVTRYELQPLAGVKISRITNLADDIALNLATTGVRIEAPIPGKAAVGVEIPNKTRSLVTFRSILESPEFSKQTDPLAFAVGKDIAGHSQVGNLAKMPHLLIAGTTGSGKSVCTNSIIMSFLYRCPPQLLRLILIDPKMVEFAQYNGIPHLMMPVVTEPRKASGALGAAVAEMERRYHLLADNGVPNIEEYNSLAEMEDDLEKLPYIVIVIDELADLMMAAGKEVEEYICRIAQKARAAGMHLIVATQRPSVDVITGLIKANIPSRIGLSVMSQIDSRTILDTGGAEKLLGNGDMLYMPVGVNKPVRVQGTFIRSVEIKAVIDFIKKHSTTDYNEGMIAEMEKRATPEKAAAGADDEDNGQDAMFTTAVEVIIDAGQASTSLLQRRCKLGYARAARIMDEMELAGIIGPSEGSKPRQVLIGRQQWLEMSMRRQDTAVPDLL